VRPGSASSHREEVGATDATTEVPAAASAARCDAGTVAGTSTAETVAETDAENADGAAAAAAAAAAGAEKLPPKRRFGIDVVVGSHRADLAGVFPFASEGEDKLGRTSDGPGKLIKPSAERGLVAGPSWGSFGASLGWVLAGTTSADPPCMPLKCLCQLHLVSRGLWETKLGSLDSLGAQGANRCVDVGGAATVLPNGETTLRGVVIPDGDTALRGVVLPDGEAALCGVDIPM